MKEKRKRYERYTLEKKPDTVKERKEFKYDEEFKRILPENIIKSNSKDGFINLYFENLICSFHHSIINDISLFGTDDKRIMCTRIPEDYIPYNFCNIFKHTKILSLDEVKNKMKNNNICIIYNSFESIEESWFGLNESIYMYIDENKEEILNRIKGSDISLEDIRKSLIVRKDFYEKRLTKMMMESLYK